MVICMNNISFIRNINAGVDCKSFASSQPIVDEVGFAISVYVRQKYNSESHTSKTYTNFWKKTKSVVVACTKLYHIEKKGSFYRLNSRLLILDENTNGIKAHTQQTNKVKTSKRHNQTKIKKYSFYIQKFSMFFLYRIWTNLGCFLLWDIFFAMEWRKGKLSSLGFIV